MADLENKKYYLNMSGSSHSRLHKLLWISVRLHCHDAENIGRMIMRLHPTDAEMLETYAIMASNVANGTLALNVSYIHKEVWSIKILNIITLELKVSSTCTD